MQPTGSPLVAAIIASTAAGPLFVLSLAAATLYLDLPRPIEIEGSAIAAGTAIVLVSTFVGFFLSFVPNLIGTVLLKKLAEQADTARIPALWTVVGGLIGLTLVYVAELHRQADFPTAFALVSTSSACARICRQQMLWPWGWAQA